MSQRGHADGRRGQHQASKSGLDHFRVVGGLIYGVIAAVVGAAAVIALFIQRTSARGVDIPNLSDQATGKFLGWTFYNAHTVPVKQTAAGVPGGARTFNILKEYPVGDTFLFHAIPAVLLVLAGYVVAHRTRHRLDGTEGAIAGASVLVGYGAVALAGAFYLTINGDGITSKPALQKTAVFMVAGYPILFGGLGGLLAN